MIDVVNLLAGKYPFYAKKSAQLVETKRVIFIPAGGWVGSPRFAQMKFYLRFEINWNRAALLGNLLVFRQITLWIYWRSMYKHASKCVLTYIDRKWAWLCFAVISSDKDMHVIHRWNGFTDGTTEANHVSEIHRWNKNTLTSPGRCTIVLAIWAQ